MIRIIVGADDFDTAGLLAELEGLGGGGVASFTGLVRDDGGVTALELEHYPAMTERALSSIVEEARKRWPLLGVIVVHRVGRLAPGERIVFVGTASAHRAAALDGCAFLIDWLKTDAPFWKKTHRADGADWVEPRAEDGAAKTRWNAIGAAARDRP